MNPLKSLSLLAVVMLIIAAATGCQNSNLKKSQEAQAFVSQSNREQIAANAKALEEMGGRMGKVETGLNNVSNDMSTVKRSQSRIERALQNLNSSQTPSNSAQPAQPSVVTLQGGHSLDGIINDASSIAAAQAHLKNRHQTEQQRLAQQEAKVRARMDRVREILGISDLQRKVDSLQRSSDSNQQQRDEIIRRLKELAESSQSTASFRRDALELLRNNGLSSRESLAAFRRFVASIAEVETERIRIHWQPLGYRVQEVDLMPNNGRAQVEEELMIHGGRIKIWKDEREKIIYFRYRSTI